MARKTKENPISSTTESVLIAVGIGAAIALGYMLLTKQASAAPNATPATGGSTITPASGSTTSTKIGDVIQITLPATASGQAWESLDTGASVLQYVSSSGTAATGIVDTYKVIADGQETLSYTLSAAGAAVAGTADLVFNFNAVG